MKIRIEHEGVKSDVIFDKTADRIIVRRGDQFRVFHFVTTPTGFRLSAGERIYDTSFHRKDRDRVHVSVNGSALAFSWIDLRNDVAQNGGTKDQGDLSILAVMPGRVAKIHVKEGDKIEKGQPLLILEAMKMENEVRAKDSGRVSSLVAEMGKSVEAGELLMKVEPITD